MPANKTSENKMQMNSVFDAFYDSRFNDAQTYASLGRLDEAMACYAKISNEQAELHFLDALAFERRGDRQGCIEELKKSVSAYPGKSKAWVKLASLQTGAAAEKAYRSAIEVDPGNIEAHLNLANLLISNGSLSEAESLLQKSRAAAGNNFQVWSALANAYWMLGAFSEAEPALRKCIKINPDDIRSYYILLELFNRLDRVDDAELICKTYLQRDPGNRNMLGNLAQALIRQKRWNEAETVFLDLLKEQPGDLQLRHNYAEMLKKSGRVREALAIYEKNIEIAQGYPEVYLQLADMQQLLGQKEAASLTCRYVRRIYAPEKAWGLHMIPFPALTRFVFCELEQIAARFCTGARAIIDNTGMDPSHPPSRLGEVVELFCMVVGQEHIDFAEHVSYPSLLATDGFGNLLRERKVLCNVYTTPADLNKLGGFLEMLTNRGIGYRVNIELLALSQDLYAILCLPLIDQVKRSLRLHSAVVMALPDAIISGSIARVLKDMKPGETVACAMPRINSVTAYEELSSFFRSSSAKLNSREFVRKCMTEFMHPQSYSALHSDSNCLHYRDFGSYYSAHNWVPPPVCFYAREEMLEGLLRNPLCGHTSMASFFACDHDFIDSAFRSGNLRLIDDSDYFFWAELTHPQRHTDFLAGRKSEDYYYPESSKSIFKHEFKWIYRN